ncbi:MAG: hypothetical protein AAGI01_08260 [Myxococcota bacterium]
MAITPRTILTNPASAALAAASLFAMTAAGMYAFSDCSSAYTPCGVSKADYQPYTTPCEPVRMALGHDKTAWSEFDWFQYSLCFDKHNDSRRVVEVTTQGLRYYPTSESLYNLKGYHQISMRKFEDAVHTLSEGMTKVGVPSSGTMANNLAWASLWVPRELELDRARTLYQQSMQHDSSVCETMHTGLWVEFAISKRTSGIERAQALRNLNDLSEDYKACEQRYRNGDWDAMIEVLGAAVIYEELDQQTQTSDDASLLRDVAKELRKRYRGASIDALCRESIPLATAHHTCINVIGDTVTDLRREVARTR